MGTRTIEATLKAALSNATVRIAWLFQGQFGDQTIYLWNGHGQLSWNGQTWIGAGNFLGLQPILETEAVRANGFLISLSGVDGELRSLVLNDARHSNEGRVYLALRDSSGALIGTPYLVARGWLDVPHIVDGGELATLDITYESRLIKLQDSPGHRYTREGQRAFDPTDEGFDWVVAVQEWNGFWGYARDLNEV